MSAQSDLSTNFKGFDLKHKKDNKGELANWLKI